MAVSSTTSKVSYSASGSQTVFAYTFKIFADADLKVYVNDVLKTLTTDYTVSDAGVTGGGNVTFGTGLTAADSVVIERVLTLTQGTDYVENDPFPAETHEDALDRLTFVTQQHQDALDRTVKFATTVTDAGDMEVLGSVSARASKLFAFDSAGDLDITQEIGAYKGTDTTTTTAAYVQRDLVKSTTTAQLNNVYICTAASAVGILLTNTSYWALVVDAVTAASSASAAAASAAAALVSENNAQSSEDDAAADLVLTNADVVLTHADVVLTHADVVLTHADVVSAEAAKVSAEAALDSLDDRWLGAKATDPTLDNDGDALIDGAMYYDTTLNITKIYDLATTAWKRTTPTTGEQTNINTVSAKATEIALLGTTAAIADMAILGTADVVADMNVLATADVVTDMNVLATADVVSDMNTLGTADVVTDMNTLGTADVVSDMNTLGTAGNVTNMNTLAGISANVTTVAGISANVTTVAGVSANVTTVAGSIADVNRYANEYKIAATAPASPTEGDLWYDSTANELKYYDGSAWTASTGANHVEKTSDTGSAKLPAGTTAQRDGSPAAGYLRWNSTDTSAEVYDGTAWAAVGGGNSTTEGLYEHANTISANYSITSGNNAGTFGPISIDSGISVTIPSGSVWTIA